MYVGILLACVSKKLHMLQENSTTASIEVVGCALSYEDVCAVLVVEG